MSVHETIDNGIAILTMDNPPVNALNSTDAYFIAEKIRSYSDQNNNIKVGIHCLSPSYLKDKLSNGYDLGTLASDVRIYAEGISNKMKEARS